MTFDEAFGVVQPDPAAAVIGPGARSADDAAVTDEEFVHFLFRDSRARIGYGNLHICKILRCFGAGIQFGHLFGGQFGRGYFDHAFGRVFQGVRKQVMKDLVDFVRIGP